MASSKCCDKRKAKMWEPEPGWLTSVRALASLKTAQDRLSASTTGAPALSAPPAPDAPPRAPLAHRPLEPALDLTLRQGQEAVVKQKALGRVAALEALRLEGPPPAGPLLKLGQ